MLFVLVFVRFSFLFRFELFSVFFHFIVCCAPFLAVYRISTVFHRSLLVCGVVKTFYQFPLFRPFFLFIFHFISLRDSFLFAYVFFPLSLRLMVVNFGVN